MDAGLVGEGVAADDGLVALHLNAGDVRNQPAGRHQPLGVDVACRRGRNPAGSRRAITTSSSEQLPARSPMPLIVHSIWPGAVFDAGQAVGHGQPQIVVAVNADHGLVDVRHAVRRACG